MIPLRPSHVAYYATVVTLTVVLVAGLGFSFIRRQMLTGNDFLLDAESQEILARVSKISPPFTPEKMEDNLHEHSTLDEALFFFQIHEPTGRLIFRSPNLGEQVLPDLTGGANKRTINLPELGLLRVGEYRIPGIDVQIAVSLRNFQNFNNSFMRVVLVGVPVICILSIGFATALRYFTLRPLRLMQSTAHRISANNLSERILVPRGSGDMANLARLLNEMFNRLEKSFNHAKRFTADTSHELMTPLSIIRLHAERLLNDPDLPEKHHHSVEELLHETLHLSSILERLLMLAKADSTVLPLKLDPASTNEYMNQFAEDAYLLAESCGLKLELGRNDTMTARFDAGWIRQVLFNLLSNAIRYSPPNGTITIRSISEDEKWLVEISDEGAGVPADSMKNIFERFVQITPRSSPGSGAGLGLAICKSIIELHKGDIQARNRTDRSGFVVVFRIPVDGKN